jgi:phenylpropionate dioxygenase-like ring-hydroxylating dioxygenase large terminal subunit
MNKNTENELIEELLGLHKAKSFFMTSESSVVSVERYRDAATFEAERQKLFRRLPVVAAHSSELENSGDFLTRVISDLPLLLSRDSSGGINAFLNICRHRGAELVAEANGCKQRFSCPYHAWTYSNDGLFKGAPHLDEGFPNLIKSEYGLTRLPALEREGLIWIIANPTLAARSQLQIETFIEPLISSLRWLDMRQLTPAASDTLTVNANWKILTEGGLEAYHFKVAHRKTIAPYFIDNLSTFRMLGEHSMHVLAKNSLAELAGKPKDEWDIPKHCNIIFAAFPLDSFLLIEDHIAWIHLRPIDANSTEIMLTSLVPSRELTAERMPHWEQNHAITKATLMEDWRLNEGIQRGLNSGVQTEFTLGRFESALMRFNQQIDHHLTQE